METWKHGNNAQYYRTVSLLLGASESDVGLGPQNMDAVTENGVILVKCFDRASCRDRQIGRSAGKLKRRGVCCVTSPRVRCVRGWVVDGV